MRTSHLGWPVHVLVIVAYLLLALALTWPLAAHFADHVPGDGADDPPLTWNLWWVRYALLERGGNPLACDHLFYPLGINLAFYTLTLLNGLLSLPLQAVVGLIPASNLLLLSSFVLSGYGAFLLVSYQLARRQPPDSPIPRFPIAAFTAGLLYAFASSKMFYAALGQWNIASSQWIPFYVLYLFKTGERPRQWRYPLLAALFLLCQAYAELTYASFLVLFTALWAVYWLLGKAVSGRRRAAAAVRLTGKLIVIGLLFAIGLAPLLAAMLPDLRSEGNIWAEGGGFADVFAADLLGFLVPTMHHPIFGSLVNRFHFDHTVGQHLYLGYAALLLALLGVVANRRRTEVKFWSLSTLVFWLLTLGPTLRVNGHDTGLPLPFALIARLPFFQGNRYPSRYSVMLMLSLAMLVGFGTRWLLSKAADLSQPGTKDARRILSFVNVFSAPGKRHFVTACCVACLLLVLFEHLSIPLPLSDMQVPPVYDAVAAMPGDFTLLDLPVAWRNGSRVTGTLDPIIMFEQYYQSVHHKRLLAGNTSRNPPLKFQYFTEAPLINTLIALETGHPVEAAVVEHDRSLAARVLRFFNIQAIVVHPQAGPAMPSYVEAVMPVERFFEDGETIAYRVALPPWPDTWTIVPGEALARLSYAEGWSLPADGLIWAQRQAVRLLVPLNGEAQQMTFRAYAPEGAPGGAPGSGQQLTVEANGQIIKRLDLAAGWADYELSLPAGAVRQGLNEIWLRFDRLYPAAEVRLSSRAIGGTGVESPVSLTVHSAGQEVGDFGHIYVAGRDVSPGERGYNVAVIDPQTGAVEQIAAFDTHLDEGASPGLAAFLGQVPMGHIVGVAAADEASRLLGAEAVEALRGIGAAGDLRDRFRWGHAVIGVQGAAPGTALEAMDWLRPVAVVAGEGVTEPHLAAAFGAITFAAVAGP